MPSSFFSLPSFLSLSLLFLFFGGSLCDGTWSLTKCGDPATCSNYVSECMLYFDDVVNARSSTHRCSLFPSCHPGYELLTDVNLELEQVCLRSDLGGSLFYTMGDYVIPTNLNPFTNLKSCIVSIRHNSKYSEYYHCGWSF